MHNLHIIGTSHIARESVKEIKEFFEKEKPDIVAVELDAKRLYALFHKQSVSLDPRNIFRVGLKGYLFALIGSWASKKLGKIAGVEPGTEMKTAVKLARKNNCKLALIDRDIEVTLRRFSKYLSWKEKFLILADLSKAVLKREASINDFGITKYSLSKVPSEAVVKKVISNTKKRYPNIYRVLVKERNEFMADKLKQLMREFPDKKILAVVGAGHKEALLKLVENTGPRITYTLSIG